MNSLLSKYQFLDTPCLLIDFDRLKKNILDMQQKMSSLGVALRPHTKTHKTSRIALMQVAYGAKGITVAKVGEAETMANGGISDVFIANEIIGVTKLQRICTLGGKIHVAFGVDSVVGLEQVQNVFAQHNQIANVMIEVEVGENRSGVTCEADFLLMLGKLKKCRNINLEGVFSHEGFTYKSESQDQCLDSFVATQNLTLKYATLARENGFACEVVSVGATPTAWLCKSMVKGITEVRCGTYVFMDEGQSNAINDDTRCAASILATVISKPTNIRTVCDVGAKGLTKETRTEGLCATKGFGKIANTNVFIDSLYDEHAIINNAELNKMLSVGDKIEIIPNHICPVVNLYHEIMIVSNGNVIDVLKIDGQGQQR